MFVAFIFNICRLVLHKIIFKKKHYIGAYILITFYVVNLS